MLALIPLIVAIAGALVYALAANSKAAEIGRAMLWCGLLVVLFALARWKGVAL